jgi:hypothetical protein
MTRRETLGTRYGEMLDMLACLAIYNGRAEPLNKNTVSNFEATLEVL